MLSRSVEETYKIAEEFAKNLKGGDVIILNGDLGAGKTTFTKGLAKALNIKENITSPTFTLMNIYLSGKLPLYHYDMYRITDEDETREIGLNEYFYGKGICVVEWAENIKNLLPKKLITINITKVDDNSREFEIIK